MTTHLMNGLKISDFETEAALQLKNGKKIRIVSVDIDDRAATRQAIILAVRRKGCIFHTRSDWKAKPSRDSAGFDWDYTKIALHHAGNNAGCSAPGMQTMRASEAADMNSFGHFSYHYAIDCAGEIYEALDIRERGTHLERDNAGVIGIVLLADLSERGESFKHGADGKNQAMQASWRYSLYSAKTLGSAAAFFEEFIGKIKDAVDVRRDNASEAQVAALCTLIEALKEHFNIRTFGGHREYALKQGSRRSCPGAHGLALSNALRDKYTLSAP